MSVKKDRWVWRNEVIESVFKIYVQQMKDADEEYGTDWQERFDFRDEDNQNLLKELIRQTCLYIEDKGELKE